MAEVFDFGLQQHKIKMDGKFFESNLFAVAGDTGRRLEVQLLDSNNMVQNTTGISLRLNANVAGQATYAEATLVDATKGLYELDLPNGMLIAPGNWQFQWQIIGTTGEKLHSFAFMGSVGSNLSEGGSEATNFYLNVEELKQMQEDLINGTFDSVALETNIAGKLNNLEETYAPKLTEVTAQLAHTANKVYTKSVKESKPMVSFYLDDGYSTDYTLVYPKAKQLGIPVTICMHNDSYLALKDEVPTQRREELIAAGWEIHGHTVKDQNLNELTYEEQLETMRNNKDYLEDLIGERVKGFCYPRGVTNADSLKAARELFDVAMGSVPAINSSPIDTYFVNRVLTDSYGMVQMKAMVDKIKAEGKGWIVFYAHTNQFSINPSTQDNFFEIMDYVVAQGVEVANVSDAMSVYENTLDIGDIKYSPKYTKIGSDGTVVSNQLPALVGNSKQVFNAIQGTSFPSGVITVDKFGLNTPSDIPFDGGIGTVYTDRLNEAKGLAGSIATQKFVSHKNRIVTRHFQSSVGWSAWVDVGLLNKVSQGITDLSPITDFAYGQITTVGLLSGDAPNLPSGGIGTLITDRTGNIALNYQLFLPYRSNAIYKRFWNNSTSSWSDFEKHSISYSTTLPVSYFGNLAPNASATKDFTVTGLTNLDGVSVNLLTPQEGIVYTCSVTATNTLSIRIYNISSVSINASLSFILSVIKR